MKQLCCALALVLSLVVGMAAVPVETLAAKNSNSAQSSAVSAMELVDINKADEATLAALPGIGPKTATAIAEYRQQHGAFKSLDELQQVKGIGEKKLAKLKPYLKTI